MLAWGGQDGTAEGQPKINWMSKDAACVHMWRQYQQQDTCWRWAAFV